MKTTKYFKRRTYLLDKINKKEKEIKDLKEKYNDWVSQLKDFDCPRCGSSNTKIISGFAWAADLTCKDCGHKSSTYY